MAHTYEELKKKTVAQLRDIAKGIEHDAVQGYTQMNKEHLLVAICRALHIDLHEHHRAIGINKAEIKARIKSFKQKRDAAIAARDHKQLKSIRRTIHHLKRRLHKATV